MNVSLLDCISHGTTWEEFLASFDDVREAAKHLRDFYVNALWEAGEDVPDDDALDELEADAVTKLRKL